MRATSPAAIEATPFLESLEALAAGPIAERAADNDRDAAPMPDNFRDLADLGATRMALPSDAGGLDPPIEVQIATLERIAAACGSTAFTLSQHLGAAASLYRWSSEIAAAGRAIEEIVDRGATACISNSFPSDDLSGRTGGVTFRRNRRGLIATGALGFASGSAFADVLVARGALVDGADGRTGDDRLMVCAVIPMRAAGVTVRHTWDAIGMRGSGTHDIALESVDVASDAFAIVPANELETFGVADSEREQADRRLAGATLVWGGTWLGLGEAAYALVREHAANATALRPLASQLSNASERRVQEPWAQTLLARIRDEVDGYRALIEGSATRLDLPDPMRARWMMRNFAAAGRMTERVATDALTLGGAHAYGQRSPLDRVIRDLLAAVAMTKHPAATALYGQWLAVDQD